MKISERIRRVNGEKPDFAIDDIGDIGHWQGMNDAALIAEAEELVQLTDDQQVVLEWLTENIHLGTLPFNQISLLNQSFFNSPIDTSDKYLKAFGDLDSQEQFQVLAAFAEWGMSND